MSGVVPLRTTASSHGSSSSPGIDTPQSPYDSENDDEDVLEDLEEHGGYELQSLSKSERRRRLETDDGMEEETDVHHHQRRTSVQSFELYTPDEDRAVRRKLDTHLVLFVALLYMMSFLDRSNIGNCKIAGLTDDLHMSSSQFEWLLTAFYITYIAFEWMTICYKLFPPHIYISCCVLAWGVLASLQSLVTSFPLMILLRALLGISEAAFVGIPLYLSFFFRQDELAFRTGLFISAAPLATSFAGSLAWAIVKFGDKTSIASWRLLLLIEGFPACLVAVWAWHWLPDSPETTSWLTLRERRIAVLRVRNQGSNVVSDRARKSTPRGSPRHRRKFDWSQVRQTFKDPASYLTAGMFFCCNIAFSSMPVFLPTIMNQMGFSRMAAQGLSAPPFLVAFVVVLITAFISDRMKSRSIPMLIHASLACAGYTFLAIAGHFQAGFLWRYLAIFPVVSGFFSAVTLVITWTVNNQLSDEGKGTGMAINNFVGQIAPLLGTRLYPDSDGPYFVRGMSVCAAAMALVWIFALALKILVRRRNRDRRTLLNESERAGLVASEASTQKPLYME